MKTKFSRLLKAGLLFLSALAAGQAYGAYDCSVSVTSIGTLYVPGKSDDAQGTVSLICSRGADDANELSFRIKADTGLNASGTQRRVRRGATTDTLTYYLSSGACANSSNWFAPPSGTVNVITGTLLFGSSLTASVSLGYCIRMPSQPGGAPTAGIYTDVVNVFAQYPNSDTGALTVPAFLNYSVGVDAQCVFATYPGNMLFNYTSFSPTAQSASQSLVLRCSNNLPWSVSVDPPTSSMLGLSYSIAVSPSSGTGLGNAGHTITLTGTIPAGQAGTCALGTCSATQTHTITISY